MRNFSFLVFIILTFQFANAQQQALQNGLWRATITLQGKETPFHLDFKTENNQQVAYIRNADEKLKLDNITIQGDSITIPMHVFDAALIAKIENNNLLTGKWVKYGYKTPNEVPFKAEYGIKERFHNNNDTKADIDFSGKWSVTFKDEAGKTYPALGVFKQKGKQIIGTFLTTTGDYRYLEGIAEGNQMKVSTFDGSHGFLFEAKAENKDELNGEFWAGKLGYETFTAFRNDTATLPNPEKLTYLKEGYESIDFNFPDLDGKMVSLKDEKYKGKVVIIQLLGSWCPNCMDETAFLSPFFKKNKNKGIEIIGLAYERSADFKEAKTKVERLKKRYQIDYDLLVAGTNNKIEASKTLPMLNAVLAFPTTIIIDRQGKVRKIHTGFEGPGTGKYYEKFVREFNQFINRLVTEQGN